MKNKKGNHRKSNILRSILSVILCVSLITSPLVANANDNAADNGGSTANEPQIIVIVETTDHGNGSSTETKTTTKTWTEQDTTGTPVDPQAAPAEGSSSVSTVTTSGTEIMIESTTTDDQNRVTENSGTVTGSETTTTDTTTTNVTSSENQTIIDTTTTTTTVNGETTSVVTDGETISTGEAGADTVVSNTESTGWIPGETPEFTGADEEEGWNNGTPVYSETPDTTEDPAADDNKTPIPIEEPSEIGVTLNMTPGTSDSETVTTVTLKELVSSNITMPTPGVETEELKDAQGNIIGTKTITTSEKTDAAGNVIGYDITTKIETVKETGRQVTDSVPETEEGFDVSESVETDPILPSGIIAEEEDLTDEDGNVIGKIVTEIETTTDQNGRKVIIVTRTKIENMETTAVSTPASSTDTGKSSDYDFILPEKPAASSGTDPVTGNSTLTTVEDILDGTDRHVGYRSITIVSSNGKELSRTVSEIYGTYRTINTDTETAPTSSEVTTSSQTTTKEVTTYYGSETEREVELTTQRLIDLEKQIDTSSEYQFIEVDGQLYFLYSAEMGTPYNGDGHGSISNVENVTPSSSLINGSDNVNLEEKDLYKKNSTDNGNYYSYRNVNKNTNVEGDYEYKLVGNGLASIFEVATKSGSTNVHQFKLVDSKGNAYYAYCVDMSTGIQVGWDYELQEVSERTEGGYKDNGTDDPVSNITRIALNGFWGTESGIGSLSAVQQFLAESGYDTTYNIDASKLTEGQAVAATQAALWKYGNSGNSGVDEETMLNGADETDVDYVKALYYALLNANGTALLDADDITGSSITVKSRNEDSTYNTDVGFTLDANPSEISGDLVVNIMDGTNIIKTAFLTGTKTDPNMAEVINNGDGTYTVKDVVLADGAKITLNISGLQQSAVGVKIYVSEIINKVTSQTLVGLTRGNRNVNINVDLTFHAEAPEVNLVEGTDSKTEIWNATRIDTRTDIRTDKKIDTLSATTTTVTKVEEVNTKVYATVTVTEVINDKTTTSRSWSRQWSSTFDYDVPEYPISPLNDSFPIPEGSRDPGGQNTDEAVLIELIDEEVPLAYLPDEMIPLANVPRTGDLSGLWMAMLLLSALGLITLNILDRKQRRVH